MGWSILDQPDQEIAMKEIGKWVVILATLVFAGCASNTSRTNLEVSKWNPETGEAGQWVLSYVPQSYPSWLRSTDSLSVNYLAKKSIDPRELANVREAERVCRQFAKETNPSIWAASSTYAILFGASGGLGLGLAASGYTGVGVSTGIAAGVTNAITGWDLTYAFAQCAGPIVKSPNIFLIGPYSQ